MRRAAIARPGPLGAVDAFIVGVLAYAGLRPQELLALHWEDVLGEEAKLFVARKNVDGQLFPYLKSGRSAATGATAASTSSSRSPPTSARTA